MSDIATLPRDATDLARAATDAHRAGDMALAERCYRALLADSPGQYFALSMLGVLCGQTNRAAEAITLLHRAAVLRPSDSQAFVRLGMAHELAGDAAAAVAQYDRALAREPDMVAAHFQRGVCLQAIGETQAAETAYRRVIALAPDHAQAHNNLGNLLSTAGDMTQAAAMFRRAIALAPDYAEASNNLGGLHVQLGELQPARLMFARAIALRPDYADAMCNLGTLLSMQGRPDEALAQFRAAVAADPSAVMPHWMLAQALIEHGDAEAAEATLRAARALDPGNGETLERLAQVQAGLGHFADAADSYAAMAALGVRPARALHGWAQTRRISADDAEMLARMRALDGDPALTGEERTALHFALGKAEADLGDIAAAMRHWAAGNALKRAERPFDRAAHRTFVDAIIAATPAGLFAQRASWGSPSTRPILIVGMMRSGTTLVERILTAHPSVAAGGEVTFWPASGSGASLPVDAQAAAGLIAGYLATLDHVSATAAHVTDKLPHNVFALGMIHLLFPRARILHCRRDPRDVGLSIWRTLFGGQHDFAYDTGDIAFFLREYERIAAHWRAVLPADRMMEVKYEALVADPTAVARAMLDFCGLSWDDAWLEAIGTGGSIRTASTWQARQPVYRSSVGAWRRYAAGLGEIATLDG